MTVTHKKKIHCRALPVYHSHILKAKLLEARNIDVVRENFKKNQKNSISSIQEEKYCREAKKKSLAT